MKNCTKIIKCKKSGQLVISKEVVSVIKKDIISNGRVNDFSNARFGGEVQQVWKNLLILRENREEIKR